MRDFIVALLALSAFFAVFLVWPMGAMKDTAISGSGVEENRSTGNITGDVNVFQSFIPQYSYIRSIGVLVDRRGGESRDGNFLLEVYDAGGVQQRQVNFKMPDVGDKAQGYFDIPVNLKVIPGAGYIIRILAFGTEEKPISILYRTKSGAGPAENQNFSYGGMDIPDASLACRYTYGTPLGRKQILVYALFFVMLFFVARNFLVWLSERRAGLLQPVCVPTAVRLTATCGVCWVWVFSFYYLFIRKLFGGDAWDFGVYGAALVIGMAILLYLLWKGEVRTFTRKPMEYIPDLLQVVGFGVYFSRYAPYFNSGSNYGHAINGAYMSVAFAVVVLSLFKGRLLFHWRNLLFTVLYGGGCAMDFLRRAQELSADDRVLYLWVYAGGWLWGIVLVTTAVRWIRGERPRAALAYVGVAAAFICLTVIFRYEKWWPIMIAVLFGLLYCQKMEKGKMMGLLRNFCRGALLSFWYACFYSLLHRPYHNSNYARYGMNFSSVAIAGLYLVFVFAALLLLLVEQYRKGHRLKQIWFYYLSMGVLLSYVFMSLSRTAMLAILLLTFALFLGIWLLERGRVLAVPAAMAFSFLALFPVVYTLTRCVPAIVNEPVAYPYEEFEDGIYKNERKDSPKYMSFSHFAELSTGRLMTLAAGLFDRGQESDDTALLTFRPGEDSYAWAGRGEAPGRLADARMMYTGGGQDSPIDEISNGRFGIFKIYLSQLNWVGHDSMVMVVGDDVYGHSHNTYLQIAYDHGILCGVVFLALMLFTLLRSILYVRRNFEVHGVVAFMPFLFLLAFLITGMVEWVFQPVIPLAFGVLFGIYPLMAPIKK